MWGQQPSMPVSQMLVITITSLRAQARLLNAFTSQPTYNDAAADADFALVTLAQPVGDAAGWMGFEYPADSPQTVDLTTAGEHHSLVGISAHGDAESRKHRRLPVVHKFCRPQTAEW